MKSIWGLFWMMLRTLKIAPLDAEAGIPLMHQLMNSLHKELLGCFWINCTATTLTFLPDMNLQPFSTFLRGQNTWQLQMTSQS
jgi:hypothetical protein